MTSETWPWTLYHGTCTLFETSIRRHGLGSRSPLSRFKVLEFFRELYRLAELHLAGDQDWKGFRCLYSLMADQVQGSMNWRHGDVYLAVSRQRAMVHACQNSLGSELLTCALNLYRFIGERAAWCLDTPAVVKAPARRLIGCKPRPLIVASENVPMELLTGETDETAYEVLEKVRSMMASPLRDEISIGLGRGVVRRTCPRLRSVTEWGLLVALHG